MCWSGESGLVVMNKFSVRRDPAAAPAAILVIVVGYGSQRFGDGRGFLVTTVNVSASSMISIAWSAAMFRKVWVVLLVGQVTVKRVDGFRVEQADRLDEGVASETAVVADHPVDRASRATRALDVDLGVWRRGLTDWSWCR